MMNWGWRFGDGMGFWWLLGLLCLIVLAVAVVWVLTTIARGGSHVPPQQQPWQPPYAAPPAPMAPPRQSPYEILRERLARGEITVDDYQRTIEALGPEPPAPGQPPAPQGPVPPPSF